MKTSYSQMTKDELVKEILKLKKDTQASTAQKTIKKFEKEIQKQTKLIASFKIQLSEMKFLYEDFREKYFDLFEMSPVSFIILDEKGKVIDLNLSSAELISISKEEIKGTSFVNYLAADMRKFINLLNQCKKTFDTQTEEFIIVHERNNHKYIHLTVVPFYDYLSKKIQFRLCFTDITTRKQYENSLLESEKRFRVLADSTPVLIWMADINSRIEYLNKTKADFLGVKDITTDVWFQTIHPEDREKFKKVLSNATKEQKGFSLENRVRNSKGEYRWILDTAAPRYWEDGTFIGLIGSGIDITTEKKFRTYLEKSLKEKELLFKEVHHRVKNNLQIVSSILHLQSMNISNPDVLAILESLQIRIRSMAVLHEKLYGTKDIQGINSRDYLSDIARHIFETYKGSSGIKMNLAFPDIRFSMGLSLTLGLIITELLTNSLKHAFKNKNEGNIDIGVEIADESSLLLNIRDDGEQSAENMMTTHYQSFGLQLVETMTQQHNGTLEIIQDEGTEFRIGLRYSPDDIIN